MKYQITYEDALEICNAYKNFNFYKTEFRMKNFKLVTFNYFLCDYKYFIKPLENEPRVNALDMRGVTFVFNEDGTLYKRFLMLKKFFNLNQVEETQIHLIKDKEIKNITIKEDGSLIAFMNLPDGTIFAKTQGGFDNEQAVNAMKLYENQKDLKEFINKTLESGYTPLFEYVAYDNRIVLKYSGKELRLIGIRDNDNGNFYSAIEIEHLKFYWNIPTVKRFNGTFDDALNYLKTATNMEGVVIEFKDSQMVKIKCPWYCNLHGIRTVNIFREDYVIKNYLNETLDDATSELNMVDDSDAFKFIDNVISAVKNWANHIDNYVEELVRKYHENYKDDWDKYAIENHKMAFFGLSKIKIDNPERYNKGKIEYMLKRANKLMDAKKIVETFILK